MTDGKLMSADEVADLLDVAPSTLAKWRQSGSPELPFLRIGGRVFYRAEDVQGFLEEANADDDEDLDDEGPDDEDPDDEDSDDDDDDEDEDIARD